MEQFRLFLPRESHHHRGRPLVLDSAREHTEHLRCAPPGTTVHCLGDRRRIVCAVRGGEGRITPDRYTFRGRT
jgi:hypothetical protein